MRIFLLSIFSFFIVAGNTQNLPPQSPKQILVQDFGLGKIKIEYSRPAVRGRSVFENNSELAPLGKLWRLGANAATRMSITTPINFGGKNLDTGTYVLYAIPGAKEWEIIVNKGLDNWGTDGYKESQDVTRITVPVTYSKPIDKKEWSENLELEVNNIGFESAEFEIEWANAHLSFPIKTDVANVLRKEIEQKLNGPISDSNIYYLAAEFYFDFDKNNEKALKYTDIVIQQHPDYFWMILMKAKILVALGRKEDAKQAALLCRETAQKAKADDYVRYADTLISKL